MLILLQISTSEEWWWFHLWRRVDPQIHLKDIHQRTAEEDSKLHNRISNISRRVWGRQLHGSWFNRRPVDRTHTHNTLRNTNIPHHLNNTRGLTPGLMNANQPEVLRIPRLVLNRMGILRVPIAVCEGQDQM